MNLLKIILSIVIIFSLSFLIGGWGIVAVFYAIAYLILLITRLTKGNVETNDISNHFVKLGDLVCKREMITKEEFNNMKAELGMKL